MQGLPRKSKDPIQAFSPPLDEREFQELIFDIKDQLKEGVGITKEFVDDLADVYSLTDRKDELKRFIKHFTHCQTHCVCTGPSDSDQNDSDDPKPPNPVHHPQLAKISLFEIKQNLIKWIVDNEPLPTRFKLKKLFGCLTLEQLEEFKICYNELKYITFEADQLFEEERRLIFDFFIEKKSLDEIATKTYVHPYLVWQLKQQQKQSQVDEYIKDFLENFHESDDHNIDYLLKNSPKLQAFKPQVIEFFQALKPQVISYFQMYRAQKYLTKLWDEYLQTEISAKDKIKAKENSQIIFDRFQAGSDLNEEISKFIKANDEEKSKHFNSMWSQFQKWKQELSQETITQEMVTDQKLELQKKLDMLKDTFKILLHNQVKEIQEMQGQYIGLPYLFQQARLLILTLTDMSSKLQKKKLINESFEKAWNKIMQELSGRESFEQLRLTHCEYLTSTFKSFNQFMSVIEPREYKMIVAAADSEDLSDNQDLPKTLIEYLVNRISREAYIENGRLDSKDQFKFDPQMLGLLKDPSERIFCEKEKDKYLPLQTLFKVTYTYEIIEDMVKSLNMSSFYDQILQMLKQVKTIQQEYVSVSLYIVKQKQIREVKVDDEDQIIKSITCFFQDFGQAGFGLLQEINNKKVFKSLSNFNVEQELREQNVFNDNATKNQWIQSLKDKIAWKQIDKIEINQRVQQILKLSNVKFENENDLKIDFGEHYEESKEIKNAMWCNNKPILSYKFSIDDAGGKINVENLTVNNNLEKMSESYFQCIINPVKYELALAQKWQHLAKVATMLLDWKKIVLTINEKVSKEMNEFQQQNQNKVDEEFDLRNVLERNQITLEQVDRININQLQSIIKELDDELLNKLALFVHPNLQGVITWVACVIVWYKQQKNIRTKFNEQQRKLESQKETYRNNFTQIALNVTAHNTNQGARSIFIETFKIFNEKSKGLLKISIDEFFQSADVQSKFDTDKVYDYMDNAYISSAKACDYKKFIGYVQDPVSYFERYADSLESVTIKKLESVYTKLYQDRVIANINCLRKRLVLVHGIIQKNRWWEESINLFEISKAGETQPLSYQDLAKIESQLSTIYLSTLKQILEGTFKIGSSEFTLKSNEVETKFVFTTKSKSQNEIGSPLQDLQNLQFEKDNNLDLIQLLLARLGLNDINFGICSDLRVMIEKLIETIDSKLEEIKGLTLNDIFDVKQQVLNLKNNAVGCRALCKLCNRKCEHKPHNDAKDGGFPHSCEKRGHQLRVFAGGCLETSWGERYPNLLTCDEIEPWTHIKITNDQGTETRLWAEFHKMVNTNWDTNYTKFKDDSINPVWAQMHSKLENFWKELGEIYCKENYYKYILLDKFSELNQHANSSMNEKSIVILCLDDSQSMFPNDFPEAVAGGQEVEKYLKDNHKKPNEVHIQLWYNDCRGVTQAYKGQLNNKIPSAAWERKGCQSDQEIKGTLPNQNFNYGTVGQFTGALRIINKEVSSLLDQDSSYQNVYWFMFTDGGSLIPHDELEQLRKTFEANPKKWTNSTGTRSKLIPLIVTNLFECKPLVEMSNILNQISKEIWKEDNFCQLKQDVALADLAATMIERFTHI